MTNRWDKLMAMQLVRGWDHSRARGGRPRLDGRLPRFALAALATMAMMACRDGARSPAAGTSAANEQSAPAQPSPPSGADGGSSDTGLALDVRGFVARWLMAQNQRDFSAYGQLYAASFEGVRRSGTQTKTLDRAGWLADRRKMFDKPMVVEATDIEVLGMVGDRIRLRFVQTWASGDYKDRGRKEMELVREGGQVMLVREELLESSPVPITPEPAAPVVYPIVNVPGQKPFVVLSNPPATVTGSGPPSVLIPYPPLPPHALVVQYAPVLLVKAIPAAGLPEAIVTLGAQGVAMFDADGKRCRATLAEFVLLSGGRPDSLDTHEKWTELARPDREVELAALAWSDRSSMLAARVSFDGAPCRQPLFALPAADPEPTFGSLQSLKRIPPEIAAAFENTSVASRAMDKHALEQGGNLDTDDLIGLIGSAVIASGPDHKPSMVAVLGDFLVAWHADGGLDKLEQVNENQCVNDASEVAAAADVDRDGVMDLIVTLRIGTAIVRKSGTVSAGPSGFCHYQRPQVFRPVCASECPVDLPMRAEILSSCAHHCTARRELWACEIAGQILSAGKCQPVDRQRAYIYFANSCQGKWPGQGKACLSATTLLLGQDGGRPLDATLGVIYAKALRDGTGVPAAPELAATLLTKHCHAGEDPDSRLVACEILAESFERGLGVERDPARAIELRRRAQTPAPATKH